MAVNNNIWSDKTESLLSLKFVFSSVVKAIFKAH